MTEQEQNQEPSLEDRLLQIGEYSKIVRGIDKSKKASERYSLYADLAKLSTLEIQDPNLRARRYKEAYGDIRISPEEAIRYGIEGLSNKAGETEPLYKGAAKEKIVEEVFSNMESDLSKAKDGAQAASVLANYLRGLYDAPELDQVTANEYAQEDAANDLGVSMNYSARGSISNYQNKHESLNARLFASQYLKEKKNGDKVVGYQLNKKKLMEDVMGKLEAVAVVYSNTKKIQKVKKEAEEVAKKSKKK